MGKGQRKARCGVVINGDSNKRGESTADSNATKRKGPKREFQGKLSHASPNARITKYLQPTQAVGSADQKLLTPISLKPSLRNSRNANVKVMQESNGIIICSNPTDGLEQHPLPIPIADQDLFEHPDCDELPLLSHRKSLGSVPLDACVKLPPPFQPNKKSVKSKRRPNGLTDVTGDLMRAPPLTESKSCCDNNHKLTEYFPVRRSARRTKKVVLEEKQRHLEGAVIAKCEEGLEVRIFEGKGRGVVATRVFCKGEFVVEYAGELITLEEAKKREQMYAHDQNTGCYMYYFKHKNVHLCVDATPESDRLGRLVNHSRFGNLITKTVIVDGQPHLVLIAKEDIRPGDEITYDYGDRSKESLYYHPWLAS